MTSANHKKHHGRKTSSRIFRNVDPRENSTGELQRRGEATAPLYARSSDSELWCCPSPWRIRMYGIYGDIYHQYTPVLLAYIHIYIYTIHRSYGQENFVWDFASTERSLSEYAIDPNLGPLYLPFAPDNTSNKTISNHRSMMNPMNPVAGDEKSQSPWFSHVC